MCGQEQEYREKWSALEAATKELQKQIFGLQCKIEGVCTERETVEYDEALKELKEFRTKLGEIQIDITEEALHILFPDYFVKKEDTRIISEFNVLYVIDSTLQLAQTIREKEVKLLPGEVTSYEQKGLAADLLDAILNFQDKFLEYMK